MVITPIIFWLGVAVLFFFLEVSTVALVCIWFAGGSLAALAISLLGAPFWLQTLVFLAVSGGLLFLLRSRLRRQKRTATNLDRIIGSQGLVTADIENITAVGEVRLGAMTWSARSTDGKPIPKGTKIKVDRIEGVKVFVSPVNENANV